ncbi:MAG: T9SS type A sorting domain-containing protein [Flavobacteriales bacterium]|nr:T9SS type A sorting domain-containing protein [Flavobacteriales bacterium]
MSGFDQTYSPCDFVTASNGDIYLNGVKYDTGTSGFINKLYKSTNQGTSWVEVSTTGLTDLGNVHSLTISGSKMILAGMDVISSNGAKIFISDLNLNTGLGDLINNNIMISYFPNPFDSFLTLKTNLNHKKTIDTINIISITGKLMFSYDKYTSTSLNMIINTDNFESGIYLLILKYSESIQTIKLIKN